SGTSVSSRLPPTETLITWPSVSKVTSADTGIDQVASGPLVSITERTSSSSVSESGSSGVNVNTGLPERATTPLTSDSVQPIRLYTPGSPSVTGPASPIPITASTPVTATSANRTVPDQLPLATEMSSMPTEFVPSVRTPPVK